MNKLNIHCPNTSKQRFAPAQNKTNWICFEYPEIGLGGNTLTLTWLRTANTADIGATLRNKPNIFLGNEQHRHLPLGMDMTYC